MYWFLTILIVPYLYMLIEIWYGIRQIVPFTPKSTPGIFISVIVPCYNEQEKITALLRDLSDQVYPAAKFEVIIVDDNSTDNTFEIARSFESIANLIVLKNFGQGKKQALRTGINASKGELLIATDADCRVGSKWINTIASFYTEHLPKMIVSQVVLSDNDSFFYKLQKLEYLSLQGITAGTIAIGNPTMCNGANIAFTKEIYNNHISDLHDEIASGDDMFLLLSLLGDKEPGICWLESNESSVSTKASKNLKSFLRQRSRWFSKWKYYDNLYINVLSIVTFVTNLLITGTLVAGIFQPKFFALFAVLLLIKSLPDYLIISATAKRYDKKKLLKYFVPTQLLYSFYIILVAIISVLWKPEWKKGRLFS
jgi:poly-beta-1,6-N-acetyl-D-glucosamine synthase